MANDVGIRVGIEGEKQFRDSLKGINSQLKNLNTELDASAQKFKNSANSEEALEEKTDILSRTIDAQKKKIELLTTQYDNQIKKLSALGDELDKVSEEFGKNSDQAAKAQTAYNRQATQVNNLGSQLNTAKSDLSRFEEQMRTASDRSIRFSEDLKSAASKLDKFSSKASSIGNTLTLGVTTPILGAGLASFKYASDLEENLNKTEVAFKENSDEVIEWSKTTLKQYGLSQSTALNMASTWGDMGTSMGIPLDTATEMSKTLVGLSADLASFKNISIDRAQTALNAVYTGETESLKELGVVMTEANLEAYAMAKGTEKSYKEMDQAEKVSLRYQYVLDKTQNSQGDFARTSDSAANQMRIAQESAKELAAEFGKKLLPAGTKILEFANDLLDSFNNLDDGTQNLIISIAGIAAAAGPATKLLGGITGVAGKVAGGIGGLVGKIKDLNTAQKNATTSGGLLSSFLKNLSSPAGIIVTATTVAIGLGAAYLYMNDESVKLRAELKQQADQIQKTREEQQKNIEAADAEFGYYEDLYDELQGIVDANGKIKEGYEDRAKFITTELSEVTGIEIGIVDNVIQKYDDLSAAIENTINKKRAETMLSALDEGYSEAVNNVDDAYERMIEAQENYIKEKAKYDRGEVGTTVDLNRYKREAEEAEKQYENYIFQIRQFESAESEILNGRYDEGAKIAKATLESQEEYNSESAKNQQSHLKTSSENWRKELDEEEANLEILKQLYDETGNEIFLAQIQQTEDRINTLKDGLDQEITTITESNDPYVNALAQLAINGSYGYGSNLDFQGPTIEQIELLKQAMESENPFVSATAQNVAKTATAALSSEDENMQKTGAYLIEYFASGIASEDEETKTKTAIIANTVAALLDISQKCKEQGKTNGESYLDGFEEGVKNRKKVKQISPYLYEYDPSAQSYSAPATYSMAKMAPASASLMSVSENAPALFSNELPEETAPLISMAKSRVAFLDISDDMYDAGVKMANSIERGIRANIMPERQEISVVMPSGSTGTTLNQTNNFYSPEALSPAETARLNRVNVRRTIQALR